MARFYDDNALRRYPFDASLPPPKLTRLSDGAPLDLPMPTVVDCISLLGQPLGVDPALVDVYLASIARTGSTIAFTIACGGAPAIVHRRDLADPDWATSIVTATVPDPPCAAAFGWRNTLVTGPLAPLAAILPDGDTLVAGPAFAFEAALVQSYRDDWVSSLNVANEGRLIAAPPGQPAPPFDPEDHIQAQCLVGTIALAPGFGATIDVDAATGTLTLGGAVGAGAGEPCQELAAYPGETPPAGSPFLGGGIPCSAVILGVNGLPGPAINLAGGGDAAISPDPDDPHGVVIDLTGA